MLYNGANRDSVWLDNLAERILTVNVEFGDYRCQFLHYQLVCILTHWSSLNTVSAEGIRVKSDLKNSSEEFLIREETCPHHCT